MSKITFEEKLEAVQRVVSGEMGSLRRARILGVNYSSVDTWVRLYKEHGANFSSEKPLVKLVTDVTEFAVGDEKLYLSPILDLYNGEIIAFDVSKHPTFSQTMRMLDRAFDVIPDNSKAILHSDQGWQYQMKTYQTRLADKGIIQSMSRKGNCLDNSVMENFFGLLKTEMFYKRTFKSLDELETEIIGYIYYYNNQRIKTKLNGMSPVKYRLSQSVA